MFIKVSDVITQEDVQVRCATNAEMIADIAESIENGEAIRPILVAQVQTGKYLILDGHHRFQALQKAGKDEIEVIVNTKVRSMAEAVAAGVAFNAKNGLRLTRADIMRSIELLFQHDPKITIPQILAIVRRSKSTVYDMINELQRAGKISLPETRVGADGKERPTSYEKNVHCGNPRCQKFVSASYISQLEEEGREDGDWVKNESSGKWYCSTDCETEAELETEADAILEEAGEEIEPEVKPLPSAKVSAPKSIEMSVDDEEDEEDECDLEDESPTGYEPRAVECPFCGCRPNWLKRPTGLVLVCANDTHTISVGGDSLKESLEKWNKAFQK